MTELPRDEIFRCPNAQLAFALAVAGVPFAPIEQGGPAINTYTLGFFDQPRLARRFKGKGMDLTECAQQCVKDSIPGNVTYSFVRCQILDDVIAAWDEMASERTQAAADKRPPEMPQIPSRIIAQVLFVAANSTAEFKKAPFINRMMQIASTMEGSARKEPITKGGEALPGARTVIEGAGKAWSIFGSKALKDHMKV